MKNRATLSVHSGEFHDPHGAVMPPIYATSTFAQPAPGDTYRLRIPVAATPPPRKGDRHRRLGRHAGTPSRQGLAAISTVLELLG